MRAPNRDIQIFSMSALDLLAMATGVFVLLLVLLMPYYRKTLDSAAAIEGVRAQLATIANEAQALEPDVAEAMANAAAIGQEIKQLNAEAERLESQQIPEPLPEQPEAGGEEVIDALDLVFVIDTTASMQPVIRDLALSMRSIVRILERLVPSVQIAVVAYKDRDTGLPPVITTPLLAIDPYLPRIIRHVERLQASTASSLTIEEDVHLGIEAASLMRFREDAIQSVVLIGDAPVHDRLRETTIDRVSRFARGHPDRSVSALFTSTPSSRSQGDRGRYFFETLAKVGGGSFNDHAGSMTESILLSVLTPPDKKEAAR